MIYLSMDHYALEDYSRLCLSHANQQKEDVDRSICKSFGGILDFCFE
jgi:hypothetical protein